MTQAIPKPSFYCDYDHPDIRLTAQKLKGDQTNPIIITRQTVYFVRDHITYGFDLYQRKASEVLKRGYGVCWNKALLLTALLRSNGISSHFCSIPLKRTFCKPAIGVFYLLANTPFNHCLVSAHLNDRPTILDVVLDTNTFETFYQPIGPLWNIEFNGKDDMRLFTESITGPLETHCDIDLALNQKVGNLELPKFIAPIAYQQVNRWMWRKTGQYRQEKSVNAVSKISSP